MKKEKTILFDFDGVLVDSFNMAFETTRMFIRKKITENDFREFFEDSIYKTSFAAGFKITAVPSFFKILSSKILQQPAFPGIKENLEKLSHNNNLAIISSCHSDIIENWLSLHNIRHHFDKIMGMDVHTSKIQKIKMIFEERKISPQNCVFITDTLGDIKEADKVGVKSLAVTYGFHNEETLMKGNPVGIINSPDEMITKIDEFFNLRKNRRRII